MALFLQLFVFVTISVCFTRELYTTSGEWCIEVKPLQVIIIEKETDVQVDIHGSRFLMRSVRSQKMLYPFVLCLPMNGTAALKLKVLYEVSAQMYSWI